MSRRVVQMYQCVNCSTDLERSRIVAIDQDEDGNVRVRYLCECTEAERTGRYRLVVANLSALMGTQRTFPYVASPTPRLVRDDDPDLVAWRWELDQIQSGDEFIEWLNLTAPSQSPTEPVSESDD